MFHFVSSALANPTGSSEPSILLSVTMHVLYNIVATLLKTWRNSLGSFPFRRLLGGGRSAWTFGRLQRGQPSSMKRMAML